MYSFAQKPKSKQQNPGSVGQSHAGHAAQPRHVRQLLQSQRSAGAGAGPAFQPADGGKTENQTRMPDRLKGGLEQMSGFDLSAVRVHHDSRRPGQVGALAYTQGHEIHLGPGQERHLPHEGWHVVQQMQGRVRPTVQDNGVSVNADRTLEHEADVMGQKALRAPVAGLSTSGVAPGSLAVHQPAPVTSTIQRVAPVVWAGLSLPELASVVGTVTGVAAAVGAAATAQNDKTGKGPVMKLQFEGDYLMMPSGKSILENISRVLFFIEMDRLHARQGGGESNEDEIRQTAVGNVRQIVTTTLDEESDVDRKESVANGAGDRVKVSPWGSAKVRIDAGTAFPSNFHEDVYEKAHEAGITLESKGIDVIKSCLIDYDYERDVDVFSNDDIYVRGQDLNFYDDDGNIKIAATVAFDWDGDTTYLEWKDDNTITVSYIPRPAWVGPRNPDD